MHASMPPNHKEQASLYTATPFDTAAIAIMNTARNLSLFFAMP